MKPLVSSSSSTRSSPLIPLSPPPSTTVSPLVSSTVPPTSEEPTPTDLLLATPPILLKLFALAAPSIHLATLICQLVTWQHPNFFASLLVLLAWWSICLFGRWIALYGFNALLIVYILSTYFSKAKQQSSTSPSSSSSSTGSSSSSSSHHARPPTLTPAAYSQLLTSSHYLFSHLQTFRQTVIYPLSTLFSLNRNRSTNAIPAYTTVRFLITSYPIYLLITYFVPLRYLFLSIGSTAILWNAPFFTTLRTLLWRSAAIRWIARLGLTLLNGGKGIGKEWQRTNSGVGLAGLFGKTKYRVGRTKGEGESSKGSAKNDKKGGGDVVEEKVVKTRRVSMNVPPSSSPSVDGTKLDTTTMATTSGTEQSTTTEKVEDFESDEEDVEVQFTVFENQRWWVGLDWTHALLPGERASWTDPSSNPSNPPSSFNLPPPQTTYIPSPTPSDPGSRLKKTTSWKWLDSEWKVLRESLANVALPVSQHATPLIGGSNGDGQAVTTSSPTLAPSSPSTGSSSIFSSSPPKLPSFMSSSLTSSSSPSTSTTNSPLSPTQFTSPSQLSISQDPHYSTLFANWSVDTEGWQYGDNHFEKMGPKGGLGKYTRRRAWVRRAGLVERTERVAGSISSSSTTTTTASSVAASNSKKSATVTVDATTSSSPSKLSRRKSEARGTTSTGSGSGTGTNSATSVRKRKSTIPSSSSGKEGEAGVGISKDVD